MPKIIHAADFHLDSAFSGLGYEKALQRRRESRDLLDRLSTLVREERADLVLLSGDIFDGAQVYPETLERLSDALAGMNCPVFIAPGNHDPYTPASPYAVRSWPENVHIFRDSVLTAVELDHLNCVVHGCAFTGYEKTGEALAGFSAPDDGRIHVACVHGEVNAPGSIYHPISRQQIADSGLDYLALGHIHQYSGLQRQGGTFWAYPGCIEGRGFDELGDKGVLVAEVERGSVNARFVPLARRRYRILRADVTGTTPAQAMEAAIASAAQEDICRVIFTGETDARGVDLREMEEIYAPRFYALQLRDETRLAQNIWDRAGEDSLRGIFLQEMRRRYEDAENDAQREEIALAVRFGLAAMDGRDMG